MDASSSRTPSYHSEAQFSPEWNRRANRHCSHQSGPIKVSLVCDAENGNEPSENRYGPGRTLLKALTFSGHQIDVFLSKTAERLGYGPIVGAQRIRARYSLIEHSRLHYERQSCRHCRGSPSWDADCGHYHRECDGKFLQSPASISEEMRELKKDCKRLLNYVNSNVHPTKKQALDRILDLSVDHYDVRSLLKELGAVEIVKNACRVYKQFRFSDVDDVDLLLNSSRKVLVSLGDTRLNALLHELSMIAVPGWCSGSIWLHMFTLWDRIFRYLRDRERAFLIIRVLRSTISRSRVLWVARNETWEVFHDRALPSIARSLCNVEWEEFTALFRQETWHTSGTLAHRLEGTSVNRIPRLLGTCETKPGTNDGGNVFPPHERRACVLALRNAMVSRREKNAMSFEELKSVYPSPRLEPLLRRLSCPVDTLMGDPIFDVVFSTMFDRRSKAATEEECAGYKSLVKFVESDDPELQQKAWQYIDVFLRRDIYRCERMLHALSSTTYATTDGFEKFKETKRKECAPGKSTYFDTIYRCLDENGVHVYVDDLPPETRSFGEQLSFDYDWVMERRVGTVDTFHATCLHPIVADQTKDRKCTYVARTWVETGASCNCYLYSPSIVFAVEEGTRPNDICAVAICKHQKIVKRLEYFDIYVLRYAPETYPAPFGGDEVGSDATGPFSWRPVGRDDKPWHPNPYSLRVIPAKDAFPENTSGAMECGPEDAESVRLGSEYNGSGSSSCCESIDDDSDLDTDDEVDCDSSENEDAYAFDGEFNLDVGGGVEHYSSEGEVPRISDVDNHALDFPPSDELDSEAEPSNECGVAASGVGNEKPASDARDQSTYNHLPEDSGCQGLSGKQHGSITDYRHVLVIAIIVALSVGFILGHTYHSVQVYLASQSQ